MVAESYNEKDLLELRYYDLKLNGLFQKISTHLSWTTLEIPRRNSAIPQGFK